MRLILSYQNFFRSELIKEINSQRSNPLLSEIEQLQAKINNQIKKDLPEFINLEKSISDKKLLGCFFHEKPFSNYGSKNDLINWSKQILDKGSLELLFQFISIVTSHIGEIDEMSKSLEEEKKKNDNKEIEWEARKYKNWVENLKDLQEVVNKPDFLKSISSKEDLQATYKKKDGKGEAEGEIEKIEIDGDNIEVTIKNDKVGEIKKDIDELVTGDDDKESDDEVELQDKMTTVLKTKPDLVKKILSFTNFISDENNVDKVAEIEKIISEGEGE